MSKKLLVAALLLVSSVVFAGDPVVNPFLSAPLYGTTHFDPAQTDSIPYPIARGEFKIDLQQMPHIVGGPVNIMTLASTSPDYMWGTSSQGVTYIHVANGEFKEVARYDAPEMAVITADMHKQVLDKKYTSLKEVQDAVRNIYKLNYMRIYSGIYSVADNQNVLYANYGDYLYAFGLTDPKDPSKGITPLRKISPRSFMDKNEVIAGISMTYDGNLIIVNTRSVAILDREFKNKPVVFKLQANENITNGIAVDEKNAIYVASDRYMRKLIWNGISLSVNPAMGGWASPYQFGEQPPAVKVGIGTGSTPTLMGFEGDEDKLVVITDGANRMNIVAFWRDEIPEGFKQQPGTMSRRIAGQMAVTCGLPKNTKWIQTEQSVVVDGYGAFVINNVVENSPADRLEGVIALGPVLPAPKGAEKFEWNVKEHKWESKWTNADVVSISMVPAFSIPARVALVNGYSKERGWEVTGMDWNSGKVVHRTIFGQDNYGNGAYALIQIMHNGDLLFNSIAGPFRVTYNK